MTQEAASSDQTEEQRMIAAASTGDIGAFRTLYDHYVDYVTRNVARLLGPSSEVEDVVQDVFVNVFRSLKTYRGDCQFTTWLFRVTRNVTINHIRSRPKTTVQLDAWRPLKAGPSEWARLEAREMLRALHAALESVSVEQREVFLLHEVEGMKLREIAELTEESINTVAARIRRTREKMQSLLEKYQESTHD